MSSKKQGWAPYLLANVLLYMESNLFKCSIHYVLNVLCSEGEIFWKFFSFYSEHWSIEGLVHTLVLPRLYP